MPLAKKPKVILECLSCFKSFSVHESATKRPNRPIPRYCSQSCYGTHYQAIHGGRNRKTGTMRHKGYVLQWQPDHPNQVKGYVPQHRVVMEQHIGRLVTNDEDVHHINHIKDDNRIENLQLMSHQDHMALHAKDLRITIDRLGSKKCISEWCNFLSLAPASFRDMRTRRNLSNEQTLDFYLRKKGFVDGNI